MAFDRTYFSSVNNQQCSGERIQTWQYESVDPLSKLTEANYFAPVRQSLKVNDLIWVVSMDLTRTVAQGRSNLTVRVNEEASGTSQSALVALPEEPGEATYLMEFDDLSAGLTKTLPFPVSTRVVDAYAVFLGAPQTGSLSASVVTNTGSVTVFSGSYAAPVSYGQLLQLTPGTPTADTLFKVSISTFGLSAASGKLQLFLLTKAV
jgi:hypothetical protein